jgi:hypothetical protein
MALLERTMLSHLPGVPHTLGPATIRKTCEPAKSLRNRGRTFISKKEVKVYDYRSQLGAQTKLEAIDLLNDASVLKHFFLFGDISKEEARVLAETAAFAKFSFKF